MNDSSRAKDETRQVQQTDAQEDRVWYFGQYDGTKRENLGYLLKPEFTVSEHNAHTILTKLRDFVMQDPDEMGIYANLAQVPVVVWFGKVTDYEILNGSAIIAKFPEKESGRPTYTIPIVDSMYFAKQNVSAICRLAKVKIGLDMLSGKNAENMKKLDRLLDDEFLIKLQNANLNRLINLEVLKESREEIARFAILASEQMEHAVGWNPLQIPNGEYPDWSEYIDAIHTFLNQPIPAKHEIRHGDGYYGPRQNLYNLVRSFISHPDIPREIVESTIQQRILPDLEAKDEMAHEVVKNISDLTMPTHEVFLLVLLGSDQTESISAAIAGCTQLFQNTDFSAETLSEVLTYADPIDHTLLGVIYDEFHKDAQDSQGYDVRMIKSVADALANRLIHSQNQLEFMDQMLSQFQSVRHAGKRGSERVKYASNRITHNMYLQNKDHLNITDKDAQRMWFNWLVNQKGSDVEAWTIRFAVANPEDVISMEQKEHLLGHFQEKMEEYITTMMLADNTQVDIILATDEISAISRIMADPTTPVEVKLYIQKNYIDPIFEKFDITMYGSEDVIEFDYNYYERATALLNKIKLFRTQVGKNNH